MSAKAPSKVDAAYDATLNAVRLPDGSVVAWAVAFPLDERACGLTTHRKWEES